MRLGSLDPTVRYVPAAEGTDGALVAELVESTGVMIPTPYQRLVWDDALGYCRSEDGRRRWAAFEVALWMLRQAGKGGVLEGRALGGLHLFGERRIVWSSHRLKTVTDALQRMQLYYQNCDELRRQVKTIRSSHVDMVIELYGDGRHRITRPRTIALMTRTKHTARGLDGDTVFLDETYGLDRAITGALVPLMSTRDDPQLWYTSTPPLDESIAEMLADPETAEGQVMFDLRDRVRAGEDEICYIDWGPQDWDLDDVPELDRKRRKAGLPSIRADLDLALRHNPAAGRLMRIEQIRRNGRAMSPRQYARECLCAWPRQPKVTEKEAPIPDRVWQAAADPEAADDETQSPAVVCIGAAGGSQRSHGAIAVYGEREDGTGLIEVAAYRVGVSWMARALAAAVVEHQPVAVVVSARSPLAASFDEFREAGLVDPATRDDGKPRRGDLMVATLADDCAATAQLIDALRRAAGEDPADPDEVVGPPLYHLDDPALNAAVAGLALRDVGDLQTISLGKSTSEVAPLQAAALARLGYYRRRGVLAAVQTLTAEQLVASIR